MKHVNKYKHSKICFNEHKEKKKHIICCDDTDKIRDKNIMSILIFYCNALL